MCSEANEKRKERKSKGKSSTVALDHAITHADFVDPRVRGVFDAIFGLLALYCLVRFILLCRRPRPAKV